MYSPLAAASSSSFSDPLAIADRDVFVSVVELCAVSPNSVRHGGGNDFSSAGWDNQRTHHRTKLRIIFVASLLLWSRIRPPSPNERELVYRITHNL